MRRFKSVRQVQQFLTVHGQVNNLFDHQRYKAAANDQRVQLKNAFDLWSEIVERANCA